MYYLFGRAVRFVFVVEISLISFEIRLGRHLMKTSLSLLSIVLTLFLYSVASAQSGPHYGGAIGESVFRPVSGDLHSQRTGSRAGRVWFETNLADDGLGFNGSYLALGGKRRIGEDRLDGRWLAEAQLGHSIEDNGGFFANVGIERVFSIPAAGACLLYTSPSPRDATLSRMPSSA